jgi:hypothetical protein
MRTVLGYVGGRVHADGRDDDGSQRKLEKAETNSPTSAPAASMGGWGLVFETPGPGPSHRGLEDETPATREGESRAYIQIVPKIVQVTRWSAPVSEVS